MRLRWLCLAGAVGLGACSSESSEPVSTIAATEPLGTVTLYWSIGGRADEAACSDTRAAVVEVAVVRSDTGLVLETFQEPCTVLATSLPLAPGAYAARARLLDTNGALRATAVPLAPFEVTDGNVLVREVTFAPLP